MVAPYPIAYVVVFILLGIVGYLVKNRFKLLAHVLLITCGAGLFLLVVSNIEFTPYPIINSILLLASGLLLRKKVPSIAHLFYVLFFFSIFLIFVSEYAFH